MKLKNKLFIFLGIFIFMIIPKNVSAMEVYPFSININNVDFTNTNTSSNGRLAYNIAGANGTYTLDVSLESFDYDSLNLDYSFSVFPYTLILFQTYLTPNDLGVSKSTACTNSCFGRDNITLKQVGTDAVSGRYRYILILENKKWSTDCGVGSGQCVYHIDDQITFTNKLADASDSRAFVVYQVLLSDDTSILSNSSIDVNSLINNATINTNNIINNQNTNQTQTNQKLDDVKEATEDLNDTMKDESPVSNSDVSNKTNEWNSKLASTGPVSQMILLPITLLNGYVQGWNSTCSSFNIGNFFGTDIVFPCINLQNYFGSTLWGVLDALLSGFMVLAIGKKFVKIFNDFTNLRDNQMDELYGGGK